LLAVTIQDIRLNPQDISAYYLANIFQQLNGTQVPTLPNPAVSFTAPTWAVWVNGLWFMSLVISLTCAASATLLQQWARRYLRLAYPRYSPHKQARIRAFYANGVEQFHLQKLVELLPALLHISLFLFLVGLAVFLFNVNLSIFKAVVVWVGLCVVLYSYLTFLPILRKNSPYSAPLSESLSICFTGIRSSFFHLIERSPGLFTRFPSLLQPRNRDTSAVQLGGFFSHSMRTTAEQFAFRLGPEIDLDSLMWTFQSLDEDKELEQFFEGVPGLCDSKMVANGLNFIKRNDKMFSNALIELMNRTLTSNLVSEAVKLRRIIICTKVVDATSLLGPWWILRRVLLGDWQKFLECIEFGLFVQNWKSISHPVTRFYAECVAAVTISSVTLKDRDDRWFQLASGPLGTSKNLFQNYLKHRESILLANVIFILRRTIQTYSGSAERHRSDILGASSKALESLGKFDLTRTFPDLRHEFCAVWNQLVDLAQNDDRPYIVHVATAVLKKTRKLYIGLHKGTSAAPTSFSGATDDSDPVLDDARSYCECDVVEHRSLHPIPELRIEEPAPDNAPTTPVPPASGRIPTLPLAAAHPSMSFPSHYLRPSVQAPSWPQPTHPSTSYEAAHTLASVPPTSPIVGPTLPIPQTAPTLPIPQIPQVRSTVGASNEGAPSASYLSSAPSSSLGHISTSRLPHTGGTRETSLIYPPTVPRRDPILAAFERHVVPGVPPTGGSLPRDVPDTDLT
jgi:hypothetical protein